MKIRMGREYKTKRGNPVKLLSVGEAKSPLSVIGLELIENEYYLDSWTEEGFWANPPHITGYADSRNLIGVVGYCY